MIKQIIADRLDKGIWLRYIKDMSFKPAIETIYNNILTSLNGHDTEKAITYLIIILETDINFEPAHHLLKLMLFSLSEEFLKKKGPTLKNKHRDLNKYILSLEKNINALEREIILLQNNISKLESKLNEGFSITNLFKKNSINSQITQMRENIFKNSDEINKIRKDLVIAWDLCKIEEYMKISALLLEIVNNQQKFIEKGYVL